MEYKQKCWQWDLIPSENPVRFGIQATAGLLLKTFSSLKDAQQLFKEVT